MKKPKKKIKTGDEDLILLKKIIKNRCNDSYLKLKEKHQRLFYSQCNKFSEKLNLEDVYSDIDFVFFKSILSFKIDKKAKFSTWLGNFTRYHCLNHIKKNGKYVSTDQETIHHICDQKSAENFSPPQEYRNDVTHAFKILSKLKDKRIHKVFKMRYLHQGPKLTWKQIAAEFELTPQTIINLHLKGRRALRKKMKDEIFN